MEERKYQRDEKIDTSEEGLIYWAQKIRCEKDDLINAVFRVGDNYTMLILFLELNRQIKKD